mmetsp:Transcript_22464/g.55410  ORF Transcript_22464/g.55410 Transcript_22464/m.55410 type:complete len:90 (-) Transcript_22464:427-696(-)
MEAAEQVEAKVEAMVAPMGEVARVEGVRVVEVKMVAARVAEQAAGVTAVATKEAAVTAMVVTVAAVTAAAGSAEVRKGAARVGVGSEEG